MATVLIQKKRKNIDLSEDVIRKLSVMAAAKGKSLKAYIESLAIREAGKIDLEIKPNSITLKAIDEIERGDELETLDVDNFKNFAKAL